MCRIKFSLFSRKKTGQNSIPLQHSTDAESTTTKLNATSHLKPVQVIILYQLRTWYYPEIYC